jgi:hypothetical protein
MLNYANDLICLIMKQYYKKNFQMKKSFKADYFLELDGPAVSMLRHAIVEVMQRWAIIGWVTKNFFIPNSFVLRKALKPLVPAAFAVVSSHQPALRPRGGLWVVIFLTLK